MERNALNGTAAKTPECSTPSGNTIRKLDSKRLISAWKHSHTRLANDSERQTFMSVTTWGISTGSLMTDREYLGCPDFPAGEHPQGNNKVWVFQLTRTAKPSISAEATTSVPQTKSGNSISPRRSHCACRTARPRRVSRQRRFHHRIRLRDLNGNFYISAFSMYDDENAYLVGINPSELRVALDE